MNKKQNHDGDCWIYAANGICTCGLLHHIIRSPESKEYKSYEKEIEKHKVGLHTLNGMDNLQYGK